MSTGTTRAASAAASRNAKLKLVELLFRDERSKVGSNGYGCFELSSYSYNELRKAYLKKLQVLHPDKTYADYNGFNRDRSRPNQFEKDADPCLTKEDLKKDFQYLQSAWNRYAELSKSMSKVVQGDGAAANFTKFGVGCSFSDNDEEKALRKEITDQACRGWFSSGLVSSGLDAESDINQDIDGRSNNTAKKCPACFKISQRASSNKYSLIDDSMFIDVEACEVNDNESTSRSGTEANRNSRYQRTLIRGNFKP